MVLNKERKVKKLILVIYLFVMAATLFAESWRILYLDHYVEKNYSSQMKEIKVQNLAQEELQKVGIKISQDFIENSVKKYAQIGYPLYWNSGNGFYVFIREENFMEKVSREDVEGNYDFALSLIQKYGAPKIKHNFYDTDLIPPPWQRDPSGIQDVFSLSSTTDGVVNCVDKLFSYLKVHGTDGFTICFGYANGEVKYFNRHVFLKKDGKIIDPDPTITNHIITAEFKL